jgi:hypothetical protein
MNELATNAGGGCPDYVALGVPPALAMKLAKTTRDVTGACLAAVRMDAFANGEIEPGVLRPLADLPGWFVYRAETKTDPLSGNVQDVTLVLRSDAVIQKIGFTPECSIRLPHTYQLCLEK